MKDCKLPKKSNQQLSKFIANMLVQFTLQQLNELPQSTTNTIISNSKQVKQCS